MSYTAQFDPDSGFVRVVVTGPMGLADAQQFFPAMVRECHKHACSRAIVDVSNARINTDKPELYRLPALLSRAGFRSREDRVAIVYAHDGEHHKTAEKAFLDYGLVVRVFTDTDEAIAWLTA